MTLDALAELARTAGNLRQSAENTRVQLERTSDLVVSGHNRLMVVIRDQMAQRAR